MHGVFFLIFCPSLLILNIFALVFASCHGTHAKTHVTMPDVCTTALLLKYGMFFAAFKDFLDTKQCLADTNGMIIQVFLQHTFWKRHETWFLPSQGVVSFLWELINSDFLFYFVYCLLFFALYFCFTVFMTSTVLVVLLLWSLHLQRSNIVLPRLRHWNIWLYASITSLISINHKCALGCWCISND